MASTNFQNTIFDYLRVVFHRWVWIVLMIGLSMGTAYFWVEFYAPKKYKNDMTIMVWSRDPADPNVRRMLAQPQLENVMHNIHDKLQVDRRLQHLACNLRYQVKAEAGAAEDFPRGEAVDAELAKELAAFAGGNSTRHVEVHPDGAARYLFALREWLYKKIGNASDNSFDIDLTEAAAQLDQQSLALVLCPDLTLPSDLCDTVILEMRQMELTKAKEDIFTAALRKKYCGGDAAVKAADVRIAAVKDLAERLHAERAAPGAGRFDERAKRELLKEFRCIPLLLDTRLYYGVDCFYANPDDAMLFWVEALKHGLDVGNLSGNQMVFNFGYATYRMGRPLDHMGETVITHLVLQVAYAMTEAEFRETETTQYETTRNVIERRMRETRDELDAINSQLYRFDKLSSLQLSFLRETLQIDQNYTGEKLPPNWDDPWKGMPQPSVHIRRISDLYEQLKKIDVEIADLRSRIKMLAELIRDPKNLTIPVPQKERVEKNDPPEVVALKKELALKLVQLKKLLENNTEQHPFVVSLKKEVDQIKSALHEYRQADADTRSEVETRENPERAQWERDKRRLEEELAGLVGADPDGNAGGRRGQILEQIDEEKKKAEDSVKQQREYQVLLERQQRTAKQLQDLESQAEALAASHDINQDFKVTFDVHTAARPQREHYDPKESLILLMALLVGLLAAGTVVFLQEYLDHSIKTSEDVKRYIGLPILGTIPEFSFGEVEKAERQNEKWRISHSRGRMPYPAAIDVADPMPAHDRAKVKARKRLQNRTLVVLALLVAAGVLSIVLVDWSAWYNKTVKALSGGKDGTGYAKQSGEEVPRSDGSFKREEEP